MIRKQKWSLPVVCAVLLVIAGIIFLALGRPEAKSKTTETTKQPKKASQQQKQAPGFDKSKYSLTDPASVWVIVNKQHPLNPISYAPTDLVSVGNGQFMRADAAAAFSHMQTDAAAAGFVLTPDSGYRSYETQVNVYNGYVKSNGQAYTDTVSARPGYSEHQTGWTMDIGTTGCHIDGCFGDTPAGKWASGNAYKYGFLLRYPDTLTDITGYSHEAWHFRYIGPELSAEMHKQNIPTLEQFFGVKGGTAYLQ
jgi:D-alanyl-D-alanine carboxypeptidase